MKEEVMFDENMGKVAKGKKKRRRKKCSFLFLIFYVKKS